MIHAQESWDNCNFSDETKIIFPRPETEEDVKKLLYQPSFGTNPILYFILGAILGGGWGSYPFYNFNEVDENKNPEQ